MDFKLQVVCDTIYKGGLILEAETPLSGVKFIEVAGRVLRRSIDHIAKFNHITLGALASYEMNVPQAVAIDSGLFEDTSMVVVAVENDLLSDFIFYGATVSNASTRRPCYPYVANCVTLNSYIDELRFIEVWATLGYPDGIMKTENGYAPLVKKNPSDDKSKDCPGDQEHCEGCTVLCRHNMYQPRHVIPPAPWPPAPPPVPAGQDPFLLSTRYREMTKHGAVEPAIGAITIGDKSFTLTPLTDISGHDGTGSYS